MSKRLLILINSPEYHSEKKISSFFSKKLMNKLAIIG